MPHCTDPELILTLGTETWQRGPGHTGRQKSLFAQVRCPKGSQPLGPSIRTDHGAVGQNGPSGPAPLRRSVVPEFLDSALWLWDHPLPLPHPVTCPQLGLAHNNPTFLII